MNLEQFNDPGLVKKLSSAIKKEVSQLDKNIKIITYLRHS